LQVKEGHPAGVSIPGQKSLASVERDEDTDGDSEGIGGTVGGTDGGTEGQSVAVGVVVAEGWAIKGAEGQVLQF
jgi:hypothetical protein